MHLFYSGGGSPWLPEMRLHEPDVMLSWFTNAVREKKHPKPDRRFRIVMNLLRKKAKKKGKKK